ncbi:MAG: DNA repair ATPase [Phycisphaerae bacterium]|nr:DNA repair ATPase [Phycisphaerae bacterium]
MADNEINEPKQPDDEPVLRGGAYEIIQNRLKTHSKSLRGRIDQLNAARRNAFGAVEYKLLASERISTDNNCVPRDMVPIGDAFLFGYNVFVGLRNETTLEDVFAVYAWQENSFSTCPLDLIQNPQFLADFKNLYRYYKRTTFTKFAVIGHHLFMVFRVGRDVKDVKTFKWLIRGDRLEYLDNRSDHEFRFPSQHEFEWRRTTQDMFHEGRYPHISINDRVFVETVGGDLTIKIEDNTETGEGIYSEPVDNADQTLSDAEIYFATVGNVILLKIRPYEEKTFRYIVYNEKVQQAFRLDAIQEACVLLPEGHGLIFPKGYYLLTGAFKQFETDMRAMVFEKRVISPNGEDYLYIFYNRESGVYVLLSYNLIEQKIATPVVCNGYSFFQDGKLCYFRADDEAKKHHVIQIWQTPYYGADFIIPVQTESDLHKIGNKDIVRCMAECTEVLNLIDQEDTYANLYLDIGRKAEDIVDTYFWINTPETFQLNEPLGAIKQAADAAVEEYEKVQRTKAHTRSEIDRVTTQVAEVLRAIDLSEFNSITPFVEHLSQLRALRGEVVSLRDLRYADITQIGLIDTQVAEQTDTLSQKCVEFLLEPDALTPYISTIETQNRQVPELAKVTDARALQEEVGRTASDLEMLTDIVSNLKIEDATQTITIIENISLVYAKVNQVKSALKNKLNEIGRVEGQAEFASQLKLIDQSVINTLDVCDTPDKCDEYLSKTMVALENLEGRFADFEDFIVALADKREELYNAFESRKVQLTAKRNQRASALMASAERILKGIDNRVQAFKTINEINGYFAADIMIERVRDTIAKLTDLGDSVKADDIKGRLKTIHQDVVRQLKDRLALYEDGDTLIRLGVHRFSVNKQTLTGTLVQKDDGFFFHLTSTGFFERIEDETLNETRDVWHLEVASETLDVYRAEYLAYVMRLSLAASEVEPLRKSSVEDITHRVQTFMGPRYNEGYVKGVHDHDAALILKGLLTLEPAIGLLRYSTSARTLAWAFWHLADLPTRDLMSAKITGMGHAHSLFGTGDALDSYLQELRMNLQQFIEDTHLFADTLVAEAAEYLFHQLCQGPAFVTDKTVLDLKQTFEQHLAAKQYTQAFAQSIKDLTDSPVQCLRVIRDWTRSFLMGRDQAEYADELAALLLPGDFPERQVILQSVLCEIPDMVGSHARIQDQVYALHYCRFMTRLRHHDTHTVPRFHQFQTLRNTLVQCMSQKLHLEDFKPRVMTTFVRNQLIDKIYLPLIGDNLAKQIGAEGVTKRTDHQGMLLLISPPGYGKTTLMEYTANRLGLTFMKINGPAIGHRVLSFDPAEAPNATAREELNKLNLAFEMGDNVMIYVDDIQHTNPEFLQKFISLCDAQRRVEGVFRGQPRTYDLRGKRVCVIMAGNPYTESGERFKIPDMLANRADTYNIGDIVGDNYDPFAQSYIENCLISNPVLEGLTRRSQTDAYAIMKIAQTGSQEGIDFEGNYTVEEIAEYVACMKKLFVVRDVVLRVNTEYIRSAGQSSAYRTEPPFLLQGSYRNMNRIGGRVLPMMNDEELWTLIVSAYEQDAQTLTSGAEANLLKFRELVGRLTEEHTQRWNDIKKTFQRNLLLGGEGSDSMTRLMGQLTSVTQGLDHIKDAIATGVTSMASPQKPAAETNDLKQTAQAVLAQMTQLIQEVKHSQTLQTDLAKTQQTLKQTQDAHNLVAVLEEQFHAMETWLMPMTHGERKDKDKVIGELTQRFEGMVKGYQKLIEVLNAKKQGSGVRDQGSVNKAEAAGPQGSGSPRGARRKAEGKRKPPKTEG